MYHNSGFLRTEIVAFIQVCTSRNVTFENECEFYRMKCLCQTGDKKCERHRYKNAHLDYYGECTGKLDLIMTKVTLNHF